MKKKFGFLLQVVFLALIITSICPAQQVDSTASDSAAASFQNVEKLMGPMMGGMMRSMMEGLLDVISDKDSAEKMATFTKNYYDALIAKGFTKDEALKIVISVGVPSIPNMN